MDKQGQLADAIAARTAEKLEPQFAAIMEKMAEQAISLSHIFARLEVLEEAKPADAAKRGVRATGAGKKAAAGSKAAKASPDSKVSNALLFFRRAMSDNINEYREIYGTEEALADAESDPTVAKKDRNKDEAEYFSAVGLHIWKTTLSVEQKDEVRAHFADWKEQIQRGDAEGQLDEDQDA
jgi:hypothetical protein